MYVCLCVRVAFPSLPQLEFTEGYTFERGFASPYFLSGEGKDWLEWEAPRVLITDAKINSAQAMLPILEPFVKSKEPLVIVADDFSPETMQTLIINKMRGLLKVVAVKAPSFGERRKEYLRDLATATGASLVSADMGLDLEDCKPEHLGTAVSVVARKDRTSIVTAPELRPAIEERLAKLKRERLDSTSKFDRDKLSERIAALSGGIAQIRIGAATETEQKSKKLRYEDAINAVRAALETGYVPGGGVTYLAVASKTFTQKVLNEVETSARDYVKGIVDSKRTYTENDNTEEMESEVELQKAGARIVLESMKSITKQIALNAGISGDRVVNSIEASKEPFGFGWNAKTSRFGDMIAMGVIDPAKVIVAAIENSSSVAGLVLTTEGMLVESEQPEKANRASDSDDMDM
eukprot:GHVU01012026.1.p1 GENE.GHVU01012026.1~~GHVU01012026.1.p1  ORF type:complete len:407 (-),score=112.64 GHVU01012026.1:801-2021(-)